MGSEMNRREFLKVAGLSLAGLTGWQTFNLLSGGAFAKSLQGVQNPVQKQWGMVVNLEACSRKAGCNDCIDACHRIHNVPDLNSPKDEVKWIWTASYDKVFAEQDHAFSNKGLKNRQIIVLCNHCENPPCVKVCPTKATWKREDGIVMMDYHRCIGCRYCMAACPYGARSFNWKNPRPFIKEINQDFPTRTTGVVEKCNFCEERLAKNLLPACVEACEEKALTFGDLNTADSELRRILNTKFSIQRKPHLGTQPKVYYTV